MCYSSVNHLHKPYVYAVSGYKNTGKTTLITELTAILCDHGYKVATIKHDAHDFVPDVPGTDSYRHREAGAYGTAIYSGHRVMVTKEITAKETEEINEALFSQAFPEADVILLEGFKDMDYPKYFCEKGKVPDARLIAEEIMDRLQMRKYQYMHKRKDKKVPPLQFGI